MTNRRERKAFEKTTKKKMSRLATDLLQNDVVRKAWDDSKKRSEEDFTEVDHQAQVIGAAIVKLMQHATKDVSKENEPGIHALALINALSYHAWHYEPGDVREGFFLALHAACEENIMNWEAESSGHRLHTKMS